MALPGDVTTATVTFGPYTDASGAVALVGTKGTLFPVDPATGKRIHLVHVATGQEIIPAGLPIVIDSDGTDSIGPVPHTDNATLSTVGFAYKVEWQVASGRRRTAPDDKMFAVPTAAGASVDYDLLDVAEAVPGVLVPMGVSAGVADPVIAALIEDIDSETRAALDLLTPTVSDASAGTKGVLRLTGDLGGTATSPTVPGLAGKQDTATLGATVAANATVKAAFAAFSGTVQARWNVRQQANYDRDNALGFSVYVDFVNGNDANTGAHPGQAWKTLGKLTTAGIAAGSRIGLARGSTFTGAYTVPTVTGTLSATNRVVFGAYGLGAAPKITGGTFTIAQPYIDVQDIRFTATSSGYALFIFNGSTTVIGNQIKRCEFDLHTSSGAIIAGIIGGLIEDNYFHDVWNNLEYPSGNGYAMLLTTGSDQTEVRYNVVRNCYKGIGSGNTNRSLNIHHNVIDKCRVNGIDLNGGVLGAPPRVVNNFVWHRPTTPNGHGINTQAGTVGPYWRNNIVVSDYNGPANNVELYCIDSTTYTSTDIDRNLGWIYPGSSGVSYAKLGATNYATLAAYRTALASTSYGGKEANSIEADPLIADLAGLVFVPTPASPAINAGVVVPGSTDTYLGTAPDLGAYEVT